ncbi:tRNA pseudouridine(13) synthase TruD [Candidatus Bathyarchaeota archaeon]|nr:MAG: tRNA pseudouridine(13) synthase TruD [Candidatus Bathyarchaeota archaeon]
MFVPKLEKLMGIEVHATRSLGIGGAIRQFVEDFIVEEVLVNGSKAQVYPVKDYGEIEDAKKERYLLCVLIKRNWDTFRAIREIANQLNINSGRVQIAGIKDAKAVTAQHITIEDVTPKEVKKIKVSDIEVRPLGYFRSKLSSYFLLGNNFHVTIRAVNHSKTTIKKRLAETLKELKTIGGVPNFFGHQRFGTTRPITHLVGKAIVQGNFKKAAMLFLAKPSPFEHPESREAREQLHSTQDFEKALKIFPKQLHYERLMLKHLAKKPKDFVGAFRRLPPKLRQLFPQAYQAYLFNKFLSRRIACGLPLNRVEAGDYIVNVERSGLPMIRMYKIVGAQKLGEFNQGVKKGRMRLALPIIGFKQSTSQGVQGEIEKEILEEEGITPEQFKISLMPEISAKGELRTALTELRDYSLCEISRDTANPPKYLVRVHFTLYRGSYATVFLREIMKPRNPIKAGF